MSSEIEHFFGAKAAKALHSRPKAEYIDRSDLEAFADCPHQGQLRKQHEGEFETHEPLPEIGKLIHAVAETAIKTCNMDLQEAADYITEELPKTRPDLQPETLRAGRTLANRLRWSKVTHVLLCEEQITRSIMPATNKKGELLVTTAPDLVLATSSPDKLQVIDCKTGWKERSNQEARDEVQTCVICWCLKAKYEHIRYIDFRYWNTRKNTTGYAYIDLEQIVGGTKDDPLMQEMAFEQRIFEAARLYMEGCDEAWPTEAKCSLCPVLSWCKYADEVCKELDGDPKAYVDNTLVLSEVLKRREKAISDATKNGRTLFGSGGFYNDTPKKKSPRRVSFKEQKDEETKQ